MKTLTTIFAAAVLLTSCTKTDPNCAFESDCRIIIESDLATHKFITKKELKEKQDQLFKASENHLF